MLHLSLALDALHEPLAFWVHYNDPQAKRELLERYEALPTRQRAALEQAVERSFQGPTLTAYRRTKPGDRPQEKGGMSVSTDRPGYMTAFETFELRPEDVLIHWAVTYPNGDSTALGSKGFGHEHEVILRPDARPRRVGSGRTELHEQSDEIVEITGYHFSHTLFDHFDLAYSSPTAVWGPGVYLSARKSKLSGWSKHPGSPGYLYEVLITTAPDRVAEISKPTTNEVYARIERGLGRELPASTKESGAFPFIALEKRYGTVADALRAFGFDVLIHQLNDAHGKHYLVLRPEVLRIVSVQSNGTELRETAAEFFHVTDSTNRELIRRHGLRPSRGWISGPGVFVTTNPYGWLFMFEGDGVYSDAPAVDIWAVDVSGLELVPDDNETADPDQDFRVVEAIPASRVRLVETIE
jgi:hypothetical protein